MCTLKNDFCKQYKIYKKTKVTCEEETKERKQKEDV